MSPQAAAWVKLLTSAALAGLLLEVGLRVTWLQVVHALRISRLGWVLPANFVLVPLLTVAAARVFDLPMDIAVGMVLLAAAPFAPVVPIFTKMAGGDLALAAVLTALFPLTAVLFTPVVCELSLAALPGATAIDFHSFKILVVLLCTISMPLALGVAFRHFLPAAAHRVLRPVEFLASAAGAVSLLFVTVVEFRTIVETGWKPLVVMAALFEISLLLGYATGGPSAAARRVLALGTSNRNIALALLVAVGSFPRSPVVAAVVANGLVLILLGLAHVALWRIVPARPAVTSR